MTTLKTVAPPAPDTAVASDAHRSFRDWARQRPFVGGVLMVLSGIEMFFSGQLDLGNIQIQFGISGLQATIIPLVVAVLGVLVIAMPQHRIFYGVIGLALVLYALVGVNLGGFIIGTLLGAIGGILAVAWMPRAERAAKTSGRSAPADAAGPWLSARERIAHVAEAMAYPVHLPAAHLAEAWPAGAAPASAPASDDLPEPPPFGDAPRDGAAPTIRSTARDGRSRTKAMAGRAAAVAILTVGVLGASSLVGTGTARAAEPAREGLCIPLLMDCSGDDGSGSGSGSTPTPTPTATDGGSDGSGSGSSGSGSGGGLGGVLPGLPGTGSDSGSGSSSGSGDGTSTDDPQQTGKWGSATSDDQTVFTLPAQRMTTQGLSFSGLEGLGLVKVPLANGKTATVIKLAVDQLTMTGYQLDIRRDADGPAAIETDDRIVLSGHVVVYLDSLSALGLTLATDTPPPTRDEFPDSVSDVSFGLIGATADHMDRDGVHLAVQ